MLARFARYFYYGNAKKPYNHPMFFHTFGAISPISRPLHTNEVDFLCNLDDWLSYGSVAVKKILVRSSAIASIQIMCFNCKVDGWIPGIDFKFLIFNQKYIVQF